MACFKAYSISVFLLLKKVERKPKKKFLYKTFNFTSRPKIKV